MWKLCLNALGEPISTARVRVSFRVSFAPAATAVSDIVRPCLVGESVTFRRLMEPVTLLRAAPTLPSEGIRFRWEALRRGDVGDDDDAVGVMFRGKPKPVGEPGPSRASSCRPVQRSASIVAVKEGRLLEA